MKILMMEPYPAIQGPLPRIVPLLSASLRRQGLEVEVERWGKRGEQESLVEKVFGRLTNIIRVAWRAAHNRYDILFVPSAHDWRTIARDVPLFLVSRLLVSRRILQIHGTLLDWLSDGKHPLFRLASSCLFRLCDAVIVSSTEERDALMAFAPSCEFFVADNIYEPIDVEPSAALPAEWNVDPGKPVLFFAARLIQEKGVVDLLDSMPLTLSKVDCHLLIAGVGPLEGVVGEAMNRPALRGHVSWVRYLDRASLERAYASASVFVLPTYHIEGFPAVVQDALAHGIPVVTSPIRGLADHLSDRVHGRMVPPHDPVRLAEAIVDLLQDPQGLLRISEANKTKAREFSANIVGPQYALILNHVMAAL